MRSSRAHSLFVKRSALSLRTYAARVFARIYTVSTLKPAPSSLQVLFHHAAKVRVLCVFKALDAEQTDEISLKEFYKLYDVLSLRWERVSTWSKLRTSCAFCVQFLTYVRTYILCILTHTHDTCIHTYVSCSIQWLYLLLHMYIFF